MSKNLHDAADAIVVGSGPNGLAAAVTLARAGLSVTVFEAQDTVGGGARTLAGDSLGLPAPGVNHDICSAVHPLAVASPFFEAFDLAAHGVEMVWPEASYGHPLDDGRAAIAWHDLDRTVEELPGEEGKQWRETIGPLVEQHREVTRIGLSDFRHVPAGLANSEGLAAATKLARFMLSQGGRGSETQLPGEAAGALLTGVAAHAITPLRSWAAAGTAALLATLGHTSGWPIPVGGSQAITDALVAEFISRGGRIYTGQPIYTWKDLPPARAYLFDTTAPALADIWAGRMPARAARKLKAMPSGAAATKVDFVVSEPIPWCDERLQRAGTIHLGGTREQMIVAEAEIAVGRHAEHPFILVSDPASFDPTRETNGLRPVWSYAHVPRGSHLELTQTIADRIEHFAPGFRDTIVAAHATPAARMSAHNANYVGGDIAAGAVTLYRLLARPTLTWDPYRTAVPGVYLCSAATPPGPGVHGMSGFFAAQRVLRREFGLKAGG